MDKEAVKEVRIVLIGKTGVGKSASGNTILGANVFPSEHSLSSVTKACQSHTSVEGNYAINVTDTPDFFYATHPEDLSSEIQRSVELASPGVHAFLYVVSLTPFTEHDADLVFHFKESFGKEALRYTIVLFTYGDNLRFSNIDELIFQNSSLSKLINECGGRYHVLNNKEPANRDQVLPLLEKIDELVSGNGNTCYTHEMLQEALHSPTEPSAEKRKNWPSVQAIRQMIAEHLFSMGVFVFSFGAFLVWKMYSEYSS